MLLQYQAKMLQLARREKVYSSPIMEPFTVTCCSSSLVSISSSSSVTTSTMSKQSEHEIKEEGM